MGLTLVTGILGSVDIHIVLGLEGYMGLSGATSGYLWEAGLEFLGIWII